MPATAQLSQTTSEISFTLAEDGEAIGTVRQFSNRLDLPESQVVPCLQEHAAESILLRAGNDSERLLIVDTNGVEALFGCAASASSTT